MFLWNIWACLHVNKAVCCPWIHSHVNPQWYVIQSHAHLNTSQSTAEMMLIYNVVFHFWVTFKFNKQILKMMTSNQRSMAMCLFFVLVMILFLRNVACKLSLKKNPIIPPCHYAEFMMEHSGSNKGRWQMCQLLKKKKIIERLLFLPSPTNTSSSLAFSVSFFV